jgi:hypothetical protein
VLKELFRGNSGVGITIMLGLQPLRSALLSLFPWLLAPDRTSSADDTRSPISGGQIIAGALAYGYYIAAALMAGARFPKFLQDHLFDGFGPAALVAFLIYRFRLEDGKPDAYNLLTFVLLYFQSAVVFAVIAAAAVFSTGTYNFVPVIWAAVIGGATFPAGIVGASRRARKEQAAEGAPGLTRQAGPQRRAAVGIRRPPRGAVGRQRLRRREPDTQDGSQISHDPPSHRSSESGEPPAVPS